jgi:hypothetical protein
MRAAVLAVGTVVATCVGVLPAQAAAAAADIDTTAASWDAAAARLGTAGSLWEPAAVPGMARSRMLTVVAESLAFANAAVTAGDTFAGTRYGTARRGFWIDEKWADTGWAVPPEVSTGRAPVGWARIRLGSPGTRITVRARVFADCFPQATAGRPKPVPAAFRCTPADVLRTGGTLTMTARPVSAMTAPGTTSVVIRSTGLTYRELVSVASRLVQVAGSPAVGAGSAQMVAMCRQMVDGGMTADQAAAFAASNGYSSRVGSVDGVPQAVTADYRPDRFTVSLVGGAVTSCSYG